MRVIFAGTPEFASTHLQAIIECKSHEVVAVLTQPDRPAGRGKKLKASAVKVMALEHQLLVLQPATLRDASIQEALDRLNADVMVVVAYGLLLPQAVLDIPKFGCINVHGSILPRWRGAAPIQRAIEARDAESGVSIMQMDKGMDTGDILHISRCPISPDMTAGDLYKQLEALGPHALLETLTELESGTINPIKQDDDMTTHAAKLSAAEGEIDWLSDADVIRAKVHGFNPSPGCWTSLSDQKESDAAPARLKIWKISSTDADKEFSIPGSVVSAHKGRLVIACGTKGEQRVSIEQAQLPGKRSMPAADVINGAREWLVPGYQFGGAGRSVVPDA